MSRTKRIITASVVALALSALASASASAATAGWMVNGNQLTGLQPLASTAAVTPSNIEVELLGLAVKCNSSILDIAGGQLIAPTKAGASNLTFLECEALKPTTCTLEGRSISTVPILFAEITLDGTLAIKGEIKPETKATFATILFLGSGCPISGAQPITGAVSFLAPEGQDERRFQQILVNDGKKLKVGSDEAKLHFTVSPALASGEPWSFL